MARDGRTVLFVSHNLTAVRSLCGRAILLEKGVVLEDGSPAEVISRYLSAARNVQTEHRWDDIDAAPGNDTVRLRRAAVRPAADSPDQMISTRSPLDLVFDFWNRKAGAYLNLSLVIYGKEGTVAFNTGPAPGQKWSGEPFPVGLFRCTCRIPGDLLNDGRHTVKLLVVEDQAVVVYTHDEALAFEVVDVGSGRGAWHGDWIGAVRPMLEWRTEILNDHCLSSA